MNTLEKEKRRINKVDPYLDLEQRAVAALKSGTKISSADIEALIGEVEQAITTAEADVKEIMVTAYDPVLSSDPDEARAELQAADFRVKRLHTLHSRLQAGYQQVVHHEAVQDWLPSYEAAKARRDKLADELREVYVSFTEKFAPILRQIDEVDRECYRVNHSSPGTTGRYLEGVEETARGHGPSMLAALHLPSWELHGAPLWRGRAR
jgi:hypothetical protein